MIWPYGGGVRLLSSQKENLEKKFRARIFLFTVTLNGLGERGNTSSLVRCFVMRKRFVGRRRCLTVLDLLYESLKRVRPLNQQPDAKFVPPVDK